MWNKLCLIFVIVGLAWSLSAQSYRSRRRSRTRSRNTTTTQEVSTQQKPTEQQSKKETSPTKKNTKTASSKQQKSPYGRKFDPAKPQLTEAEIQSIMDKTIRKKILECKFRTKLPGNKDDDEVAAQENSETPEDGKQPESGKKKEKYAFISRLDFAILMSQYKSLLDNFELIEVTRIRPEWYQQYQAELRKFGPIVNEMTIAIRTRSNERYVAAVQKFKDHQEACLKFLKEKPPQISKAQYEALVLKNTKIRKQNYLKMLQEKRQAEIKRQQEQLKRLQQRNHGAQKPAQGAGK